MSYSRFGANSDTYIFEHNDGFIECCGCGLTEPTSGEDVGFAKLNTAREALEHAKKHLDVGDMVPDKVFTRIREEHPDLDAQIEPFLRSPEAAKVYEEWRRKFIDKYTITEERQDG